MRLGAFDDMKKIDVLTTLTLKTHIQIMDFIIIVAANVLNKTVSGHQQEQCW